MPKIRGVKPDYWTDEDIVDLSIPARLLFIGLWTFACDNGHLQDKPKQIKMRIFPGDDVNAAELLRELTASGRITRSDGWITIPNLTEHQKPDLRYFTTCDKEGCDDPPEKVSQRKSRRVHAVHTVSTPGVHGGGTAGAHVDGDGDGDGELMVKGNAADKPRPRATQIPKGFIPNQTNIDLAASEGVDLRREFAKFCDHHAAKGSTFKDWQRALSSWIRKAAEYGGNVRQIRTAPDGAPLLPFASDDRR